VADTGNQPRAQPGYQGRSPWLVWLPALLFGAVAGAQPQRTIWDGVFTEAQAARGEKVYAEYCGYCHGDGLGGVEAAPALTGPAFYANWEGETLNALFERIRTGMPQDSPGSLSRAQNADIVAHMLRVGGYPAGDAELDGQAGALGQIRIVTYKP
jgi:mono/diheme cytochrome c family protein